MDGEKSDQDQKLAANNLQKEIEKLRFELEKQRLDDFNLREQISDVLQKEKKEKQNAEQNFNKELDQIKALHQIEKESIEQSN